MSLRLILIFGLAALYVAYRLYQNYRTKAGTKSLLHQLQQNPATAEEFAEGLDMLVRRVGEFVIDPAWPADCGRTESASPRLAQSQTTPNGGLQCHTLLKKTATQCCAAAEVGLDWVSINI
ncbi:MAG: hypothetical protein MUE30_17465 [Spirosomaceae bacterium]|jgi:hypothetical protein|nr:hypothetical protein [Spirosomataceae bacterium]